MKRLITALILVTVFNLTQAQDFTWNGNVPVLDNTTDTVPIPVSGLASVIDTNFGIGIICMDITHTYKNDLVVKIMSPAGTLVTLISGVGGQENNFLGTCLSMDGTPWANSQAPYTGLFLPIGNIASFNNGQNPNGVWKFIVSDVAGQDTGSIHMVNLSFVHNPPRGTSGGGGPTSPTGQYNCAACVCADGSHDCDLLPDMTSSGKEIQQNHNEVPGALYISNATPNIGYGPLDIFGIDSCFCGTTYVPCGTACPNGDFIKHAVKQRIFHKIPTADSLQYYDRFAGFMTYHPTHGHIHVDNWAYYTLRTATANPDARTWPIVGTGVKQSFCLVNLGTCAGNVGECTDNNGNPITTVPNNGVGFHTGCGLTQGIYPGSYDVYSISLNDPIPLVNVCNGNYYIVSITDPNNNFLESDENNNWIAVPITLTQQNVAPSITAGGPTTFCQGGSVTLTSNSASNYLWSTGETTQSIVVNSTGAYTVSTNCGTGVSTSAPVNVTVSTINVSGSATPSSTPDCNGGTVQLNSSAPSGGTQTIPVTFTSNLNVAIPDNNATGVTSANVVSGISPTALTSTSVVTVTLNLTHTYDGDLVISLISPSGNTVVLSNRRGGNGANFTNTVFSMSAATLIGSGSAPFSGTYKPDGNFASFTGNANGTWLLKVQDLANVDVGNILNWSIKINKTVNEVLNYAWSSTPPGFSSTLQNPTANLTASTSYLVTVSSSASGCTGTLSVPVTVPPAASISNFSPIIGPTGTLVTINGTGFTGVSGVTIAGLFASFSILSPTQIQATVPNVASGIGPICLSKTGNCGTCSGANFSINSSAPATLNLKVYLEGFYTGNGLMDNYGQGGCLYLLNTNGASFNDVDSITISAMEATPTYGLVDSKTAVLHTDGSVSIAFGPAVRAGTSYYIKVNHRNAIETWSKFPVPFSSIFSYDFTTASTQAFDDGGQLPMKKVDTNPDRWAIYNGDVNNDGSVNALDMTLEEINSNAGMYGYYITDLNGDGGSNSLDLTIIENNSNLGVFQMHP